jgi:hypothetical protein
MKKHLIKKWKREDASYDDFYSTFEIPDQDLKAQILNFKYDITSFNEGWPDKEWKIESEDGDEYKCVSGRDIKYFKKEEVEEYLKDKKENAIISAFPADKHFKRMYGIVSKVSSYGGRPWRIEKLDILPYRDVLVKEGKSEEEIEQYLKIRRSGTGVDAVFYEHQYEVNGEASSDLSLTHHKYGTSAMLQFKPDGTLFNREYNIALSEHEQVDVSTKPLLEYFSELIKNWKGVLWNPSGKTLRFFTNEEVYIPFFNYSESKNELRVGRIARKNDETYQNYPGEEKVKRPSEQKLCQITSAECLEKILAMAPQEFLQNFV